MKLWGMYCEYTPLQYIPSLLPFPSLYGLMSASPWSSLEPKEKKNLFRMLSQFLFKNLRWTCVTHTLWAVNAFWICCGFKLSVLWLSLIVITSQTFFINCYLWGHMCSVFVFVQYRCMLYLHILSTKFMCAVAYIYTITRNFDGFVTILND